MDVTSIEEVIGDFVHLKKSGANYKALSPFTEEKTPSFMVSPSKQIFKCFSSGKGGSAVTFLMEHEKWTYPEALRYLAKKYNIPLEEKEESPEEVMARSERESIAALNRFATEFFEKTLHESEEGKSIGLSYFKERGFIPQTIETFQLGYNPEQEKGITKTALDKQYNEKYLLAAGLSKEGRHGLYDFLRGRVIFPIHQVSGQVVGFGARTLKSDKKIPKYLNSPENALYNKSKTLYGLYQAKNTITKEDCCFLVEGYTDVISLHQAGIKNVVASSGTSLTTDQVKLIKRYTSNVTILFDGDTAGIKASFRGISLFLQEGLQVQACLFPDGEDPDSFANEKGQEETLAFIQEHSKDFVSFKAQILVGEANLDDPLKKVAVLKELAETIGQISDALSRSVYCKTTANLIGVEEELLLKEINRHVRQKNRDILKKQAGVSDAREVMPDPVPELPKPQEVSQGLNPIAHEKELLRILINYGHQQFIYKEESEDGEIVEAQVGVADFILDTLEADEITFHHPPHQSMLEYIQQQQPQQEAITQPTEPLLTELYADLVYEPYELSPNWSKKHFIYTESEGDKLDVAVKKVLYTYLLFRVEMEIESIQNKLKSNLEEEELISLLTSQKEYDRAKMKLSEELSRVIIR